MFYIALIFLTILALIPIVTFSLQCFLSLVPGRKNSFERESLPRLAVLIPSHNEEAIVSGILQDVKSQVQENDRVIVIADNCVDTTAAVARSHGAEAFERFDENDRGKAYALRFALEKLEADPPEVVIIVDADCRISSDALAHLSSKAARLDRPVQGSYIFGEQQDGVASNNASSFTLWFKNHIRPLGSLRLGMPCQLTGSGMAFPWHVIRKVNVANQSLAEDTTLGLELAYAGHPPTFCPEARIDGHVPKEWGTLVQQRRRWEQGYLESILSNAPKMILRSTAILLGGGAVLMGASLVLGWLVHCRDKVPAKAILAMPWFLVRKVAIYASLLLKREKVWLRTERD